MPAILVIDTGSSSMRGILFDENGEILRKERRKYFMSVEADGTAEQDPGVFARCLAEICAACAGWARAAGRSIAALSFTSQRSSILPLSRQGQPLCNVITWYDKRSAAICEQMIRSHGDELYALAGMRPTPVLSAPKMAWLRQNRPGVYREADKIVGIHDYLLLLCTGRAVTDATLASRTCLMDIRRLCWSGRLLELFGLDGDKLCKLLPPGSVVGPVTRCFAEKTGLAPGTPVVTAGGDQQCSVLGQGLLRAGMAGVTVGTGAYLAAVSDGPVFDPLRRVNLNAAASPGQWVLEASTLSSGSVYDWFNRLFYPEPGQSYPMEHIDREVSASPAGARGVLMLPDLAGKGCPDWDDWAHGVFYNLSFATTRGDCARALLEGIAAEIAECHQVLRQLLPGIGPIRSTGGLAKFDTFDQILSDMIEFPVERCTIEETTAIGAFLSAGRALGWVSSLEEACGRLPGGGAARRFEPQAEEVSLYRQLNAARRQLAQSLPDRELSRLLTGLRSQQLRGEKA